MPKATSINGLGGKSGMLQPIYGCYIFIPKFGKTITMNNLPDISDSRSAAYSDEAAIGRSFPFKNFSNGDNRTISWTCHFFIQNEGDDQIILDNIRMLEACTYPLIDPQNTGGAPYAPPPICQISCGRLLGDIPLCVILKSYSVKFDTTLPWTEGSLVPFKVDVDLSFEAAYDQTNLPGAELIMKFGD